ncbi:hypothetical protein MXD81_30640 [Microbacteriaceae bacterium K1510]|nr:hypothetical protein [Microbacteriaceae bacterium K1510]
MGGESQLVARRHFVKLGNRREQLVDLLVAPGHSFISPDLDFQMTCSQTPVTAPGAEGSEIKPDPSEGLRLLKAFMTIGDPKTRAAVIEFVESMASSHARDVG